MMAIPNIEFKIDLDFLLEQLFSNFIIGHWAIYKSRIWILINLKRYYIKIDKQYFVYLSNIEIWLELRIQKQVGQELVNYYLT